MALWLKLTGVGHISLMNEWILSEELSAVGFSDIKVSRHRAGLMWGMIKVTARKSSGVVV